MPSAAVTVLVADPPLICPMGGTDVQATIRALRSHAGAGDALPEGGSNLGRAYWLGPRPGQKLAVDGNPRPFAGGKTARQPPWATPPGLPRAVAGGSGSPRARSSGLTPKALI